MDIKIVSWNVAGLRAIIKKNDFDLFINNPDNNFDIICLQETKCEEYEVNLPEYVISKYPYRYWKSCDGSTQRKGLNGVTIWSKYQPEIVFNDYNFDNEGRLIIIKFEKYILINVYTPNSQKYENERYFYRKLWNEVIIKLLTEYNLFQEYPIIFCGDFNVANEDIDIIKPTVKKNKLPGFFDIEREQFKLLLNSCKLIDIFRYFNPDIQKFTYWSNFLKQERSHSNGWRIDYFLCSENIINNIKLIDILIDVKGSDHCPLYIILNI